MERGFAVRPGVICRISGNHWQFVLHVCWMGDTTASDASAFLCRSFPDSDPQQAVYWLAEHGNEPGRDYKSASRLVFSLAAEDPAGTTQWAAKLPGVETIGAGEFYPAARAFSVWANSDAAAAKAWIMSQPVASPWVADFQERIRGAERGGG